MPDGDDTTRTPSPPAGITRVETFGSVWMIDNDLRRYCRFPKEEKPRERPEWGGPDAGALQDFVWHDFAGDWRIEPTGGAIFLTRLVVEVERHPDRGWLIVSAPDARIVDTREGQHA